MSDTACGVRGRSMAGNVARAAACSALRTELAGVYLHANMYHDCSACVKRHMCFAHARLQ